MSYTFKKGDTDNWNVSYRNIGDRNSGSLNTGDRNTDLRGGANLMDWTPQNNRIIWGLMTPEEQAAMKAAEHGWELWDDDNWCRTDYPMWSYDAVYRAIPAPVIKPDIDPAIWRFLPDWVTHIAMVVDCEWFGYEHEPEPFDDFWDHTGPTYPLSQFNLPTEGFDWRDSCIARPEGM